MQKAQIAIWVIVALIIVVAGIVAYLLFPDIFRIGFSREKAQKIIFEQSENLRNTINYCASETVKYCLEEIGKRGGYYNVDDLSFVDFAGKKYIIVYKVNENFVNHLPSLDRIFNKSLQECMDAEGWKKFRDCVKLDNYKKFFDINELSSPKIVAMPLAYDVFINISWPLLLSKTTLAGKVEQKIEQKEAILPLNVQAVWEVANDIVNMEVNGNQWFNYADKYVQSHPDLLKYVSIRVQNYPTYQQRIFMLQSIPFRPKEEVFPFYFVVAYSLKF
ncbi:MAG: hypothetical protein QXQ30_02495 [Candidatus Pacearchaeota archaeon]